jgi:group I intron endonuclease
MNMVCKRYGSIYVAKNLVNGEFYVGQTIKPVSYRVSAHKASIKNPVSVFSKAMVKFGFEKFLFEEVYIAFDRAELNRVEKYFISELRPAYNRTCGGAGAPGRAMAESTKQKLRTSMRLLWSDPSHRVAMMNAIQKACATDEFADRCREVGKKYGGKRWVNHVKKPKLYGDRSASMKAAWANPEVRAKILDGLRKVVASSDYRAKLRAAHKKTTLPRAVIEQVAAMKHRPVTCPELNISFLAQKYAAEWVGVKSSTISEAIKRKGKVFGLYTFQRVA